MSRARKLSFGLLMFLMLLTVSIVAAGSTVTKQGDLKDFTRIRAGSAFEIQITRAPAFSVVAHIDERLASCLRMTRDGDTLALGMEKGCKCNGCDGCMRVEIGMPRLEGLTLSGAAQVALKGFGTQEEIALKLSGASQVSGDIRVGRARLTLSGASHVDLKGKADELDMKASGACKVDLTAFPVRDAQVKLSGASQVVLHATGKLKASASGVARLAYQGDPAVSSKTSGMAEIEKR